MSGLDIPTLGPCAVDSPLLSYRDRDGDTIQFVDDDRRVLVDIDLDSVERSVRSGERLDGLELVGPRRRIFFEPAQTTIGIVTTGGLCPGLNNVIRAIVMSAQYHYGVARILGFRYGFRGIVEPALDLPLSAGSVVEIHRAGGSILGSSRGPQEPERMLDALAARGVDVLFVVGGDGSMRGALGIAREARRRGQRLAVVGVPKTIDNDLAFMDQSFGFQTAFSKAVEALECAHREAQGAPNGIGLVKLMGRHSGFIACAATLASGNVNFVLVPEVPFELDGPLGLLEALRARLEQRRHALIVVAEGAGQDLFGASGERDASGNVKLGDIGRLLRDRIERHFAALGMEINVKYIDPSYIIRSVPADPPDAVICASFGLGAVHAAMSGRTELVIGSLHRKLVHVPIEKVIATRNQVDLKGPLWLNVLGSTGQPLAFQDLPGPSAPRASA
jgi:6-phosphofructokinase 1